MKFAYWAVMHAANFGLAIGAMIYGLFVDGPSFIMLFLAPTLLTSGFMVFLNLDVLREALGERGGA